MGVLSEFKAFAVKGNVVDMAVGIIIGAAFGKIVSSFVGDVIMPPIGLSGYPPGRYLILNGIGAAIWASALAAAAYHFGAVSMA